MSETEDLLFELGCEELPPKSLYKLSETLCANMAAELMEVDLSFCSANAFATPRRLAVIINGLNISQSDKTLERRGPAVKAAFSAEGLPTKAAEGFAKSCGTTIDQLSRLKTDKGEWLTFTQEVKGQSAASLLPGIIRKCLRQLPIAKRMRWGNGASEFARPVHWAVLLLGDSVIDAEIMGLRAGNYSRGHRFHAPRQLHIKSPDEYIAKLYQQGKVIVDFEQRKNVIREAAKKAAIEVGGIAHIEEELLEEITAINEWPVAVTGKFDPRFLELPVEVLVTTMQSNQKYFPVKNSQGELLPYFITFSNIESSHLESIRQGNERVIMPRLADAEFFWNQDRKQKLEDRIGGLDSIVFQEKLGTVADKTDRVIFLAEHVAEQMQVNVELAKRAAILAKTDLMTEMVGEFASLQGIMGRYYALADNEPEEVAKALEEQYYPKQSGGAIPTSSIGQVLAIAEKIDTLCGIFSAGLVPTGDKDPYALRRATLGILRVIIEGKLNLDIVDLIDVALAQFKHDFDRLTMRNLLVDFVFDRLKGYCLEHGFGADEFDAVMAVRSAYPLDFMQRLQAVKKFRELPEAESLAGANKRINNILKKTSGKIPEKIARLIEVQEKQLFNEANAAATEIQPLLNNKDYQAALNRLAALKNAVDAFFDHVMVNTEDLELRNSRLALLSLLSGQFLKIADISKLQL